MQKRASLKNECPSLWRVCTRVHGPRMAASLVLKITSDLFGFVGPLALGPIIVYVYSIVDSSDEEKVRDVCFS